MSHEPQPRAVRVAVVTGRHPFDVPGFHQLFRFMPEVDAYIQHMEDFASSPADVRAGYDVVLFYHMHLETPTGQGPWYEKATRQALEQLGGAAQGIVVLHHAILAFPDWPLWSTIVGIPDRRFASHMGEPIHVEVADANHPITRGLGSWDLVDETYVMQDAGEGSEILLTTGNPKSMRTIAWVRRHRSSPVFCLQPGHGQSAYADPSFQALIARGIRWCAGKLPAPIRS